jgi:hypothetical protein
MDEFDPFEQMSQHDHSGEFMRPFVGGMVGGFIGHQLSKTRLGQRFENSRIVGWIIGLILLGVAGYAAFCCVVFLGFLIHAFL